MSLLARFQPVCATLGGMRVLGATLPLMTARYKSTVYVRYATQEEEMGSMKALASEFLKTHTDVLNGQYVGIVFRKNKQETFVGTKGYAFINTDNADKVPALIEAINKQPTLPSGRPNFRASKAIRAEHVYLSPSPKDPYVVSGKATQEKVLEKLRQCGTISKTDVAYNQNSQWPYGFMFVEFEEDDAATKALELNKQLVEGSNTPLVVHLSVDRGTGKPRAPNTNPSTQNARRERPQESNTPKENTPMENTPKENTQQTQKQE